MDVIESFDRLNGLKEKFISKIKLFIVFGNDFIIVSKTDLVYVLGENNFGCLGVGNKKSVNELTEVKELSNKEIIDISYGCDYVLALTRSGQIISWGCNQFQELGYHSNEVINKPKLIQSLVNNNLIITSISCGFNHSMVLTDNGVVYIFGDNQFGQLGYETKTDSPQKVEIESTITAISCGGNHCSALNTSGQVFIWGDNRNKQCSMSLILKYCHPFIVLIAAKVSQISSGSTITLLMTENKQIYSFGCFECLETIDFECSHDSDIINKPFGNQKFTSIASHSSLNLFIVKSIDDNCYEWGFHENYFKDYKKSDYNCLDLTFSRLTSKTFKPIVLPEIFIKRGFNKLQNSVKQLFDNHKDYDFVFKFNNKQIFAHKFILKMQCEHFQTLFSENWNQSTEVMEITSHSYPTYYAFIKYLYTQYIELNNEDVYELFDLANSYLEEELKSICLKTIEDNISIDNVFTVYSFALKYELNELELHCLELCSDKWNQLFRCEHYKSFDQTVCQKYFTNAAELGLI